MAVKGIYLLKIYVAGRRHRRRRKNQKNFELHQNGDLIFSFAYPGPVVNLADDILGFTEGEDFDWDLFLMNIINSPSKSFRYD